MDAEYNRMFVTAGGELSIPRVPRKPHKIASNYFLEHGSWWLQCPPCVEFQQFCYQIVGQLDINAFQSAWQQSLMTSQSPVKDNQSKDKGNQTETKGCSRPIIDWVVRDWRQQDDKPQQQSWDTYVHQDRVQGMLLCRAPLVRLNFVRLDERHHRGLFSFLQSSLLEPRIAPLQQLHDVLACYPSELPPLRINQCHFAAIDPQQILSGHPQLQAGVLVSDPRLPESPQYLASRLLLLEQSTADQLLSHCESLVTSDINEQKQRLKNEAV